MANRFPELTVKVEMEYCAICTHAVPHVCPRQYSQLEIVEDQRGFVEHLRCKDRAACAKRCGDVEHRRERTVWFSI